MLAAGACDRRPRLARQGRGTQQRVTREISWQCGNRSKPGCAPPARLYPLIMLSRGLPLSGLLTHPPLPPLSPPYPLDSSPPPSRPIARIWACACSSLWRAPSSSCCLLRSFKPLWSRPFGIPSGSFRHLPHIPWGSLFFLSSLRVQDEVPCVIFGAQHWYRCHCWRKIIENAAHKGRDSSSILSAQGALQILW